MTSQLNRFLRSVRSKAFVAALVAAAWLAGVGLTPCLGDDAAAPAEAASGVDIKSDTADFDLLNQTFIHEGHVHVKESQMELWCEKLVAQMSGSGARTPAAGSAVPAVVPPAAAGADQKLKLTNIVATGSVVIEVEEDGGKSHATGSRAVYNAATDQMDLTGDPKLVNKYGTLTADRVILERGRRKLSARGNVRMVLPPEVLKQPSLSPDGRKKESAGGKPASGEAGKPTP